MRDADGAIFRNISGRIGDMIEAKPNLNHEI